MLWDSIFHVFRTLQHVNKQISTRLKLEIYTLSQEIKEAIILTSSSSSSKCCIKPNSCLRGITISASHTNNNKIRMVLLSGKFVIKLLLYYSDFFLFCLTGWHRALKSAQKKKKTNKNVQGNSRRFIYAEYWRADWINVNYISFCVEPTDASRVQICNK